MAGLSGGQRQAVAVAKSVMWNSKLLILDEPTAALGVAQTRQVLDLVRRLADRGLAVVIISHNLHDIFEVADRITVLRLGQLVAVLEPGRDRPSRKSSTPSPPGRSATSPAWPRRRRPSMTTPSATATIVPADEPAVIPKPLPAAIRRHEAPAETLGGYMRRWWQGVRAGELGSLPIIVGLVLIVIVFGRSTTCSSTERNFTNLLLQMAAIATIAIGVVFVLLIGEIDLSVAFVSAVGGVVMTLLLRPG